MIRKRDGGVRVWEEMRVGIYKRRRFLVMNRSSGQFEAKSSVEKQEAAYNWMTYKRRRRLGRERDNYFQ